MIVILDIENSSQHLQQAKEKKKQTLPQEPPGLPSIYLCIVLYCVFDVMYVENAPDTTQLVIRLANGTKLQRRFSILDSLQVTSIS